MCKKETTDNPVLFPDEIIHLSEISRLLEAAYEDAKTDVVRLNKEYRDAKRYMAEYRGEIDPHEMFQNELLLKQTDQSGTIAVDIHERIARLKNSPYFARIDFKENSENSASTIYIGPFTFQYDNELLIFDWRSPIAGMFYDYETGPAGYDAPAGRISGEITRKRQFKIKNGIMEYALESSTYVRDNILQKELSHTSDEKMKSIISTIQKEQNQIIRNENSHTLVIQGVPGSGKTSIALHRVAFLLYRFKHKLTSRNVTILSPNKVFGDYIGDVIPELGEEPVNQLSLHDIAAVQLQHLTGFMPDRDPLESSDKDFIERMRYKSTLEFFRTLEHYIDSLPGRIFVPEDYIFNTFTVKAEWIQKRFLAYPHDPVKKRLLMTAEDIFHYLQDINIRENELPSIRTIAKCLAGMLTVKSTLALYKEFYKTTGMPHMFAMHDKHTLEWADVFPFLYLHAAFEGVKISTATRHLLIDEMQDYTPIQLAVLNQLFPCPKTILGDFGQSLHPCHSHTLNDLQTLYPDAVFVELTKSYRSTFEIMNFANTIQKNSSIKAVNRHGEEPLLICCKSSMEQINRLKRAVSDFKDSPNASLGIILKTDKEAESIFDLLSKEYSINLISPKSIRFKGGISITSIRMAKGLEFDEVIVPNADSRTYDSEYDRSLLYIACTRAMHRLTLLYTDAPSPFIIPQV